MSAQHAVSAARTALRDLTKAVEELRGHHPDSVDAQRLVVDVARVGEDLDLLVGPERGTRPAAEPLEVIDDRDYPAEFWADAGDEGVGRH